MSSLHTGADAGAADQRPGPTGGTDGRRTDHRLPARQRRWNRAAAGYKLTPLMLFASCFVDLYKSSMEKKKHLNCSQRSRVCQYINISDIL